MKPAGRLALLASLVLGITLSLGTSARADHEVGHDHPFCAQGGGQAGDSSGGPGGTIPPEGAITETNSGGEVAKTVLVPTHLAARFGEDVLLDPDAQFQEIDSDQVADSDSTGSNGSAFHGGHGGGPGGGQGGSTFFGAGDGGCSPVFQEVSERPPAPGQRLPVTGTSAEQFALMGAVFLILGGTFVFAPQIVSGVNKFMAALFGRGRKADETPPAEAASVPEAPIQPPPAPQSHPQQGAEWAAPPEPADGHESSAVARLRDEISSSWGRSRED
jgi:hypothetical protein